MTHDKIRQGHQAIDRLHQLPRRGYTAEAAIAAVARAMADMWGSTPAAWCETLWQHAADRNADRWADAWLILQGRSPENTL